MVGIVPCRVVLRSLFHCVGFTENTNIWTAPGVDEELLVARGDGPGGSRHFRPRLVVLMAEESRMCHPFGAQQLVGRGLC